MYLHIIKLLNHKVEMYRGHSLPPPLFHAYVLYMHTLYIYLSDVAGITQTVHHLCLTIKLNLSVFGTLYLLSLYVCYVPNWTMTDNKILYNCIFSTGYV